jgi:hypothetical protein
MEEGVLLANPVGPICSTEKFDNRLSTLERLFDVSMMFDEFFELSTFEFFELSTFERLFELSMTFDKLFDEFVDVISPESVELSSLEVVVVAVDETLKSAISCLFICNNRSM